MELHNLRDALGNPIEFGNWYGYSVVRSGVSRVTVGVAIKATPKGKLTLKVKSVNSYVGVGQPTENEDLEEDRTPTVTTFSTLCFPLMKPPVRLKTEGLEHLGHS